MNDMWNKIEKKNCKKSTTEHNANIFAKHIFSVKIDAVTINFFACTTLTERRNVKSLNVLTFY